MKHRFSVQVSNILLHICFAAFCHLYPLTTIAAQHTAKNVLILGDSLSAAYGIDQQKGWVNLLAIKLTKTYPDYKIINASISGETTQGGLSRLPSLLAKYSP